MATANWSLSRNAPTWEGEICWVEVKTVVSMKGALWSTVVAFVIVLQVAADIPIQPNLYILKLAGRWRARGVVIDHGEVTSTLRYRSKVEVKKNGDMIDTKKFSKTTNCKDSSMHLKATDQLGKFEIASQNSILRVVDTDYDGYYIFHIESPRGNELHLYGSPSWVEERTVASMEGALWSLVAAFIIVLQVAADIPIHPNVDIPKSMLAKEMSWMFFLRPLGLDLSNPEDVFCYDGQRAEGNVLRVVDTDYDGYCIFHIQASPRNELHLYTRERSVSNAAKQKFSAAAASLGFDKDKIVYRTKTVLHMVGGFSQENSEKWLQNGPFKDVHLKREEN
ncbi:hypothetical protein lerEdw1_015903 [Lerista edwardsae]|nr:hypothetical protein lerEdw1_015903 [Lerista edwardsae]